MAIEEGIDIRIGADTGPAQKGLNDLQAQLQKLQIALQRAGDPKIMDALEEGINKTKLAIAGLTPATQNMAEAIAGNSTTSVAGSSIRAQYALNGLERGMRSLSTGSMSGAIFGAQQFAREFANLSATAGGTAGAMAKLSSMLFSPIGLIFGIGALIEIVSSLIKQYGSLDAAIKHITGSWTMADEAHKNFLDALSAASKQFDKSVVEVQQLRMNLDLASKGFVNQKEALKQYNDTLGDTFGKVNSLADAEKQLNNKAGDYVQMTMYKALATEYLNKAAKAVSDNLEEQQKTNAEAATTTDKIKAAFSGLLQSVSYFNTGKTAEGITALFGGYNQTLDAAGAATKRLSQLTAQNDWQKFLDQAKNFQKQAAEIAKSAHIDFFEGKETEKRKEIANLQQELLQTLSKYEADARVISLDAYSKELQSQDDKYNKLLEQARKYFANKGELEKVSARITQDKAFAEFEVAMKYLNRLVTEHDKFIKSLSIRVLTGTGQVYGDGKPSIKMADYLPNTSSNIKANLAEFQSLIPAFQKLWQKLGPGNIDIINEKIEEMADKLRQIKGIAAEVGDVFQSFFTKALSGQTNAFQSLVKGLEQLIIKMIAATITAAVLGSVLSLIPGAGVVGGTASLGEALGLGKSFASIFGSLRGDLGVPFANGGVISGPTMAMIGEYPGAASNPEVVAPLDKLQNIMGNGAGRLTGELRMQGTDMVVLIQRAQAMRNIIS